MMYETYKCQVCPETRATPADLGQHLEAEHWDEVGPSMMNRLHNEIEEFLVWRHLNNDEHDEQH